MSVRFWFQDILTDNWNFQRERLFHFPSFFFFLIYFLPAGSILLNIQIPTKIFFCHPKRHSQAFATTWETFATQRKTVPEGASQMLLSRGEETMCGKGRIFTKESRQIPQTANLKLFVRPSPYLSDIRWLQGSEIRARGGLGSVTTCTAIPPSL